MAAFDRTAHPCLGRHGGEAGALAKVQVIKADGSVSNLYPKGIQTIPVGSKLSIETPGGGGLGHVEERAHDAIERDIADGLVSVEAAQRLASLGWWKARSTGDTPENSSLVPWMDSSGEKPPAA